MPLTPAERAHVRQILRTLDSELIELEALLPEGEDPANLVQPLYDYLNRMARPTEDHFPTGDAPEESFTDFQLASIEVKFAKTIDAFETDLYKEIYRPLLAKVRRILAERGVDPAAAYRELPPRTPHDAKDPDPKDQTP